MNLSRAPGPPCIILYSGNFFFVEGVPDGFTVIPGIREFICLGKIPLAKKAFCSPTIVHDLSTQGPETFSLSSFFLANDRLSIQSAALSRVYPPTLNSPSPWPGQRASEVRVTHVPFGLSFSPSPSWHFVPALFLTQQV